MEERIIEKDESRKIKVRMNALGGIADATENGGEDAEESEVVFELPEIDEEDKDMDEDLIGLSPAQLKKELERRENEAQQARAERDRLLEEGERLLKKASYSEAEPFFAQALLYDGECARAKEAVWVCRTGNFQTTSIFYQKKFAEELSQCDEKTHSFVMKQVGARLEAEREQLEEEAQPLREAVYAAQSKRRGSLVANRNYYLVRTAILLVLFLAFAVAAGVSGYYIPRTRAQLPIILAAVFGGLALIFAIVETPFLRKLFVAQHWVSENEKLSSTEDGAKLFEIEKKLSCLVLSLRVEESEE